MRPFSKNYTRLCLLSISVSFAGYVSFRPGAAKSIEERPYMVVLGIAQDGGYPQSGCQKTCCQRAWYHPSDKRLVSCLALVDPVSNGRWLFDATPDFKDQLHRLTQMLPQQPKETLSGIFLTHGHIGHYTGLMNLGREVMGTSGVPVYTMPRMSTFLKENGPWSQLVSLHNIVLTPLHADSAIQLNSRLSVTPILVPHRDEFTETVGYKITCSGKTIIFIPDIDNWEKWSTDITALIQKSDQVFIDGTFYENGELPGTDMSKIPHPFITESMKLFAPLSPKDRARIHFIHFNHSNPLLLAGSKEREQVLNAGFKIAEEMQVVGF